MSNYLSILAQRAVAAPTLLPRARSRFEEGLAESPVRAALAGTGMQGGAVQEGGARSGAPASPDNNMGLHGRDDAASNGAPAASAQRATLSEPAAAPPWPQAISTQPLAAAQPLPAAAVSKAPAQPALPPYPAQWPPATAHLEHVQPLAAAVDTRLVQPVQAHPHVLSTPCSAVPAPLVQRHDAAEGAEQGLRPYAALESVSRLEVPAAASQAAPATHAGQGGAIGMFAAPAAAPAPIEIHIGRIEVHAAGAAPVRVPAAPSQAPATVSLDDYLRERSRGGRS